MTDDEIRARGAEYQRGLAAYREAVRACCPDLDDARLEHHFECTRDWSCFGDLAVVRRWFQEQRRSCNMQFEDIPLNECRDWVVDPTSGNARHVSGEFFSVHGLRVRTDAREVTDGGWDQPILTQVGYEGGLLGLLRQRVHGIPHYLLEAKAEPGNFEKVQLSPTLQATFSNLKRAHAGRKPRFAEHFEDPRAEGCRVLYDAWLSEDGGRLHLKRNRGMLVEIDDGVVVDVPPSFRWVSMHQIKALLHENAWVNPHVRGIIAHL